MTTNKRPASRCVLFQESRLDKVHGVRTPTNQFGRIFPITFPRTQSSSPTANDTSKPMSNMAMLALLKRMKRTDITVHGFRATFSTWANETAAARPDVIEACLAHREGDKIRAAYNRAQFATERRKLLDLWAGYLDGQQPVNNVFDLPNIRAA